MFKVLGGIGRSVPLYNGKARILVKAIIPVASSYLADMQSICEANGWKSVLDERGNLVVLSVVSIDAYRLSDSTLMTAYARKFSIFAKKIIMICTCLKIQCLVKPSKATRELSF